MSTHLSGVKSAVFKVSDNIDELKRAASVIWRIYREAPTNAIVSAYSWKLAMYLDNLMGNDKGECCS